MGGRIGDGPRTTEKTDPNKSVLWTAVARRAVKRDGAFMWLDKDLEILYIELRSSLRRLLSRPSLHHAPLSDPIPLSYIATLASPSTRPLRRLRPSTFDLHHTSTHPPRWPNKQHSKPTAATATVRRSSTKSLRTRSSNRPSATVASATRRPPSGYSPSPPTSSSSRATRQH